MNRIKLIISETSQRRIRYELMESKRKYQHIEIRGLFDLSSSNDISMLVRNNADSLVTLRSSYDFPCSFYLSSLQEIYFIAKDFNSSAIKFTLYGLLRAAINAKQLYMWARAEDPKLIAAYIHDNDNLEKLVLEQNTSWKIISELDNYEEYSCKLHALHVDLGIPESHPTQDLGDSFFGFINKQKDSLREIKFGGNFKELSDVLKILPHLEKITYAQNGRSYYQLNVAHPHIKEANLINLPRPYVRVFLEQNPRIEKLYVSHIDKNLLKQIVALGNHIKVLRFACLIDDCNLDYLKRFHEIIRHTMQVRTSPMEIIQI